MKSKQLKKRRLFDEISEGIRELGRIRRGERKPGRITVRQIGGTGRRWSDDVFRRAGFSAAEAHNLALRSTLMVMIQRRMEQSGLPKAREAKRLGITRRRLSALFVGAISDFTIDELVAIAGRTGLRVELRIQRERAA